MQTWIISVDKGPTLCVEHVGPLMDPSDASWNTLLSQVPMQALSMPVYSSFVGGAVQSYSVGHCHGTLSCWGNCWLYNSLGELLVVFVPLTHLNVFHRRLLLSRFPFPSTHPCRPKLSLAWEVVCLFLSPRRCTAPYSPSGKYFAVFHFLVALTFCCCWWSWLIDILYSSPLPSLTSCFFPLITMLDSFGVESKHIRVHEALYSVLLQQWQNLSLKNSVAVPAFLEDMMYLGKYAEGGDLWGEKQISQWEIQSQQFTGFGFFLGRRLKSWFDQSWVAAWGNQIVWSLDIIYKTTECMLALCWTK